MNKYLASLESSPVRSLEELIQFNKDNADRELPPGKSNQSILESCQASNLSSEEYDRLFKHLRAVSRDQGIDKVFRENDLDVIIGPGDSLMINVAASSGEKHFQFGMSLIKLQGTRLQQCLLEFSTIMADRLA
jgi:amidase